MSTLNEFNLEVKCYSSHFADEETKAEIVLSLTSNREVE